MMKLSHTIQEWSKDKVPTTWGADWDYCGIAKHIIIALNPSSHYIQKALVVTISNYLDMLLNSFLGTSLLFHNTLWSSEVF